jgi:rare lipoprotein A
MSICEKLLAWCLGALLFAGCASSPRFAAKSSESTAKDEANPEASNPEAVKTPRNPTGRILLTLNGIASYYADEFHGRQTSNGEIYDMQSFTAAHRTFPFGTKVRVTNVENSLTTIVRINDRGPFHDGRIIDLSLAAAQALELIRTGTARVRLEVLEWGDGTSATGR